jgi:drug/metabolite transporter (DMT)-like permease
MIASTAPPRAAAKPAFAIDFVLIGAIGLAAAGHLLIKYGLNSAASQPPAAAVAGVWGYLTNPGVIGGLLVYGVGTLLWIVSVSKRDISYLYPVTALNYVLIAVCGKFLFGEEISLGRWLGIAIVILGVGMMRGSTGERKQ